MNFKLGRINSDLKAANSLRQQERMVRICPGLAASFDGLKKGWRKKDAKIEADKKEMQ